MLSQNKRALRQAYQQLCCHEFDLFITINFNKKWDSAKTFRVLETIDALVCRLLLGNRWSKKSALRPYYVAFYEQTAEGNAHCHLDVKCKSLTWGLYRIAFNEVSKTVAPFCDIDVQRIDRTPRRVIGYCTKDLALADDGESDVYFSPTFPSFVMSQ